MFDRQVRHPALPLRLRHGYAVDLHRDLPGQTCGTLPGVPRPANRTRTRKQTARVRTAHQPASAGLELVTISRGLNTGSLRMPSRLAHQARPIRQYWTDPTLSRLLLPSPASSGSGCRQLHLTATTAKRRRSLTSIRTISASRRTTVIATVPGHAASSVIDPRLITYNQLGRRWIRCVTSECRLVPGSAFQVFSTR
jgi:hypothetical protein